MLPSTSPPAGAAACLLLVIAFSFCNLYEGESMKGKQRGPDEWMIAIEEDKIVLLVTVDGLGVYTNLVNFFCDYLTFFSICISTCL
uniref:Uncharacterized protein n=1 Tax=Setaria viridis TaxID=4556 RepID=A0A4U6W4I3_SETVI|nr:hypothetical protein SEVIR_1G037050v2 [Setaria viridis]